MISFGQRLATVVATSLVLLSVVAASPVAAKPPTWSHRDAHVCANPGPDQAQCTAIARTFYADGRESATPTKAALAVTAAAAQSIYFNGTSIRTAYGMTGVGDPSLVIAIVDAYDDVNAFANVTRFRTDSLPGVPALQSCTLATLTARTSTASSPCFTKTNQTGGTSLPFRDAGWSNEIDLDLQAASAVCPMCSILLLEASSASVANLATAVTTASTVTSTSTAAHVVAISNSYGISGDYPATSAPAYDNAANKGIAVTASAGDGGYGVLFPASATNVIGVGGTTLAIDSNGVRTGETVWAGTGSGCSVYNAAPAWQSIPAGTCAGGMKAVSDLSAVADPNSGLAIYTTYNRVTGYWVFGGTSLSSPIIAALYARQRGYPASTLAGQYAWAASTPYFDVTAPGSNGTCSPSILCNAGPGWDGPTGLGSIAAEAVTAPPALAKITVSPAGASVQTGTTQQFTATGTDQYGHAISPQPVTWSVSGGGTIDGNGLFSATSTGPFTVTATNDKVSDTENFTVTAPPALAKITVSPAGASVQTGTTQQFTATGTDQYGHAISPQPVTWSVSGGGTTDGNGLFSATSTGPFTVTATNDKVSDTENFTVTAPDFSLSVSPATQSIRRGNTATYTVTIAPTNGFNVQLSLGGQPAGSTVTFTPIVNGTSTLTIKTLSTTSRQTYAMTITGISSGLTHTQSVSLKVTK